MFVNHYDNLAETRAATETDVTETRVEFKHGLFSQITREELRQRWLHKNQVIKFTREGLLHKNATRESANKRNSPTTQTHLIMSEIVRKANIVQYTRLSSDVVVFSFFPYI